MNTVPATDCYVLDGGSLLHRLPWNKGDSYGSIAESYAEFTVRNYGLATVVFDGYGAGRPLRITLIRGGRKTCIQSLVSLRKLNFPEKSRTSCPVTKIRQP